jgi:serine/threonine protein kinase
MIFIQAYGGRLGYRDCRCIAGQIAAAVDHMHRKRVLHRDLKVGIH